MAYLSSHPGHKLQVQIGNGATPVEVFAHDCIINTSRGLEVSAEMATAQVPDCADFSKPMKTRRRVKAVDTRVPFAGMLHSTSVKAWLDWALSGQPKNVRVKEDLTGADGGWTLAGSYLLESFSVTGEGLQDEQTIQGVLVQADAPTVTANA